MESLRDEEFCYLTTTGRVSGLPREIEIWFGLVGNTVYMLAGGRDGSDWVKNLQREPRVTLRVAGRVFDGTARVVSAESDEDGLARKLLVEKYQRGDELTDWGRTALPIAIDLDQA